MFNIILRLIEAKARVNPMKNATSWTFASTNWMTNTYMDTCHLSSDINRSCLTRKCITKSALTKNQCHYTFLSRSKKNLCMVQCQKYHIPRPRNSSHRDIRWDQPRRMLCLQPRAWRWSKNGETPERQLKTSKQAARVLTHSAGLAIGHRVGTLRQGVRLEREGSALKYERRTCKGESLWIPEQEHWDSESSGFSLEHLVG